MVATRFVVPLATAVTTPRFVTVATVGFWLDQVTTRPGRTFWLASSASATSVTCPPAVSEVETGETRTDATVVFTTVAVTDAVNVPLVALTTVEPDATPWRIPLDEIVATPVFEDDQETGCPTISTPV
jgi:hypothetical protein